MDNQIVQYCDRKVLALALRDMDPDVADGLIEGYQRSRIIVEPWQPNRGVKMYVTHLECGADFVSYAVTSLQRQGLDARRQIARRDAILDVINYIFSEILHIKLRASVRGELARQAVYLRPGWRHTAAEWHKMGMERIPPEIIVDD